jgi:hypothetical protein
MSSTIASEKTTNYIFRPVLKTRPRKQFPYLLKAVDITKDGQLELDKHWRSRHHMMLDVLSNELLEAFQRRVSSGKIFTTHLDDSIKKEASGITEEELRYFSYKRNYEKDRAAFLARRDEMHSETIAVSELDLYLKYQFLRQMPSSEIHQLFNEMASTKFRCPFRVKLLNGDQTDFTHCRYNMWAAEPLFSLEVTAVRQTKHNPPHVNARKYTIRFKGILGALFAHNVKTLNVIWMPTEIYGLSPDAQFIYRRFVSTMVIPKEQEKSAKFKVECKDLENFCDMRVQHSTNRLKRIERALNELQAGNFIEYETKRLRWNNCIIFEVVRLK